MFEKAKKVLHVVDEHILEINSIGGIILFVALVAALIYLDGR